MDKSDKKRMKEMRRQMKKKRRDDIRAEKLSVKRQKKEIRERRKKLKKSLDDNSRPALFSSKDKSKTQKSRHPKRPSLKKRLERFFADQKKRREQKRELKKKKKSSQKSRRKYLREEKKAIKREKLLMRKKTTGLRKRISIDRRNYIFSQIKLFFSRPVKRKKMSTEQKLLRAQVRADIRRERIQSITGIPGGFRNAISRYFKMRRRAFKYSLRSMQMSIGESGNLGKLKANRSLFLLTFFNSFFTFIVAFVVMYYINQLFTVWVANRFNIPAVLYSYRIFWPLYTYSTLYTRLALIVIFSSGPLLTLILSLGFFQLFLRTRKYNLNAKLLFLWLTFHGINLFFGAYIAGVITRTGFVYTTEWLFLSNIFDVEEIIFLVSSIMFLIITGFYSTRYFLFASNSSTIIEPRIRLFYILAQVFLPWLLGFLTIALINLPFNPPELVLLYLSSILMVIPVFVNFNFTSLRVIRLPGYLNNVRFGLIYLLIVISLAVFIRLVVFNGISFS